MFDVTFCHPLSQARIRDAVQNPLSILKAWAGNVSRYAAMVHEAGRSVQQLPVPNFDTCCEERALANTNRYGMGVSRGCQGYEINLTDGL